MKTLKLPKSAGYYLLCLVSAGLLWAMNPLTAIASGAEVYALDGLNGCDIGCFNPDGESPGQVFTINVGDPVYWTRDNNSTAIHDITADSTQGDYQGNKCFEPGGLNGYIYQTNLFYNHYFTVAGDCFYRCTVHPPNPATGYPGMQGVVHVIPVGGTTTTSTTTTTRPTTTTTTTTTTTLPNQSPSAVSLTPVNISTAPGTAQSFTAVYSDPNGYLNISTATLFLSGSAHNERVDYSPATNKFTLMGATGNCSPGQAATLSDGNLTLNCSTSGTSGSGTTLTLTLNLTPQTPLSGYAYQLMISVMDQGSLSNSKTPGTWIINRPPGADSCSPMNTTTPVGTQQAFVCVYSDPDGWQNIAAANFYLSGNGGVSNEWLHYLVAPNLFTMMGSSDICNPGQAKTISSGNLNLECGASNISGSGTTLTITFRVTPEPPSSGLQYNIFSAASDQAGAAFAIFAGSWQIP